MSQVSLLTPMWSMLTALEVIYYRSIFSLQWYLHTNNQWMTVIDTFLWILLEYDWIETSWLLMYLDLKYEQINNLASSDALPQYY